MRPIQNRWRYLLPALVGGLMACSDSTTAPDPGVDPVINEAEVLVTYLEANRSYDVHGGFVVGASDVRTTLVTDPDRQYLIDIRAASDFAMGHVDGAVNVSLGQLGDHLAGLSPAAATYDKVVLICYSGQSAAFAAGVLRAMGHENVFSMKWGMSGWHDDFSGPWVNARSNARVTQFETGPSQAPNGSGDLPELSTGNTTGEAIVAARGSHVLNAGFGAAKIDHNTVFGDLNGHYIVNFWPQALFESVGHVPGAILYDPASKPFRATTTLKSLPTNKPVVLYCYTGQTSAYLAGYLQVLGYDARSLLYGTNGMIYDRMVEQNVPSAFVPESQIMNYDYVN